MLIAQNLNDETTERCDTPAHELLVHHVTAKASVSRGLQPKICKSSFGQGPPGNTYVESYQKKGIAG
jgi:hypothetical protein